MQNPFISKTHSGLHQASSLILDIHTIDKPIESKAKNNVLLPRALRPGDTIGIISPSWGAAGEHPGKRRAALRAIEKLGYRVVFAKHALNSNGYISDSPRNRAADIHQLFADSSINAIMAAIGGDHSCHLLPYLDFDLIQANPKIFCGFSDITVLNVAIQVMTGLVTFNGPTLMNDFAQKNGLSLYTVTQFLNMLTKSELQIPKPLVRFSPMQTNVSDQNVFEWNWLKPGKRGQVDGVLIGGCIESLDHLRGTRYWPTETDWKGKILFLETSDDKPLPDRLDGLLMDYQNMGVFDKIKGLLFGRCANYDHQETQELNQILLERTATYHFPIVTEMDFGHTEHQMTLPLGGRARINTEQRLFEIEAAVRET